MGALDIVLILGVCWVAVTVLALAMGRAAGRADELSRAMEPAGAVPPQFVPARVPHAPPARATGSRVRVGSA